MPTPNRYESLLLALRQRASASPPAHARRVFVDGHACGWAGTPVAQALDGLALAQVTATAVHLPAEDAALASIADTLLSKGVLTGWRNEVLDIPGPGTKPLARIERAAMRPLGLTTRSVHLNAYTPDGRLWIAQRAHDKNTDPGLWDTLVGGLIAAGETPDIALLRESNEEAGLAPDDLASTWPAGEFLVTRQVPEGFQVEAVIVTDCVLDAACQPRNLDGEVACIRQAEVAEVLDMIAGDQFTTEAALSILTSLTQGRNNPSPDSYGGPAVPASHSS